MAVLIRAEITSDAAVSPLVITLVQVRTASDVLVALNVYCAAAVGQTVALLLL